MYAVGSPGREILLYYILRASSSRLAQYFAPVHAAGGFKVAPTCPPSSPILYRRRQLPVIVPYNQVAISRESVTSSSMYNSILMCVLPFSTKLYMTALKPTHLPSSGLFETSTFPRLLVYAGCVTSLVHAASPSPYSWALYALPRHSLLGGLCGNTAARAHLTRSRSLRTLLSRR